MAMFEQLNDQLVVNSKQSLTLSLDRSWCEFFKIIKNHGPKNPPTGCNLDPKFHPQAGHVSERKMLT